MRVGEHARKEGDAGFGQLSTCGVCQETQHFQNVYAPFDGVITARNIDTSAR